jgi:hypothetical protein
VELKWKGGTVEIKAAQLCKAAWTALLATRVVCMDAPTEFISAVSWVDSCVAKGNRESEVASAMASWRTSKIDTPLWCMVDSDQISLEVASMVAIVADAWAVGPHHPDSASQGKVWSQGDSCYILAHSHDGRCFLADEPSHTNIGEKKYSYLFIDGVFMQKKHGPGPLDLQPHVSGKEAHYGEMRTGSRWASSVASIA